MKKKISALLVLFLANFLHIQAQKSYEKGYFLNNSGTKTECLIENKDWESSPKELFYKLTAKSTRQKLSMDSISAFEILGVSKYITKTVQIDKSSSDITNLSPVKNAVWQTEKLVLQVLTEGKACLYMYNELNLTRFFYSVNDSITQQLVYKMYQATNANGTKFIATNNNFRQQLFAEVNNPTFKYDLSKVMYDQKELSTYFEQYNAQFETNKKVVVKVKVKRDFFKVAAVVGVSQLSINVQDVEHPVNSQNFGSYISPNFGAELEFTLPYTRDKWSLLLQPTYNNAISGKIQSKRYYDDMPMESEFSYQAIDIPVGLRYRYFLNNKFSLNATGYVSTGFLSWNNTSIKVDRLDFDVLERAHRFSVGIGVDYKDLSFEIKAFENRNFLVKYRTWYTDFNAISVSLKYRLVDLKINR